MDQNTSRFILTPNPVALAGQKNIPLDLRPGESLYAFLNRHVPGLDEGKWVAVINGKVVERQDWFSTFPKDGQLIELRGDVSGKSVFMIIAMVALTVFTFGIGAAAAFSVYGAATAAGMGAMAATLAATAVYIAGAMLIQKVLGPKQETPAAQDTSRLNSLNGTNNKMRPYEPFGLLFGQDVKIAPDVLSRPYGYFVGDDQYMNMVLTPGFNVARIGDFMNGTTPLLDFQDVEIYHNNFSGMPSVDIPMMTNTLELPGGNLSDVDKGKPGPIINRTTGPNTIKFFVNISWTLYGVTRKGKDSQNQETIRVQYRKTGTTNWTTSLHVIKNTDKKEHRSSYSFEVPEGTYDIQVQTLGLNSTGNGDQQSFNLSSIITARPDDTDYSFIPRIGINMKASGQLNGAPNELTTLATAKPTPVWKGVALGWVTEETSNPGAQILQYMRGIYSDDGQLLAGMALSDDKIDIEAFKAFMLHCAENGFEYRYWITDKRSHENIIQSIANCAMGQVSTAGGKWGVTWAAEEQPFNGVVNMATMTDASFEVAYTLASAADGIEYSYYDRETDKTETIRVKSPTATADPINPATVTGEGVTDPEHASLLARYWLGQSLFQFKDISYGTSAEALSYKRMDKLMLQHDLTQWAYGGRVVSATRVAGGRVVVKLDEVVQPLGATAYLGIRALGERVCRIFRVAQILTATDTLTLIPSGSNQEVWPSDMPFPEAGSAPNFLWMYDIKETPGYPVRVVSVEPDFDSNAKVAVVWEGPEFWEYVNRGNYQRPSSGATVPTKVTAQNLTVRDYQVVQGNTVFTEAQLQWEVIGNCRDCNVYMAGSDGVLHQVGTALTTRSHTVRLDYLQTYTFVVTPYNISGLPGKPVRLEYLPTSMGGGPALVDEFDVEDKAGGVRRYTWGFDTTIVSPDFDGVEIRYIAGAVVGVPNWANMTPLGDEDGFFTSAVEAVLPPAGIWTFACRSRNTSGELSGGMRYFTKTLAADITKNVVDAISGVETNKNNLTKEINDRIDGDIKTAKDAADNLKAVSDDLAAKNQELANQITQQGQTISQQATLIGQNTNAIAQEKLDRVAGDLNTEVTLTTKINSETQQRENDVENLTRMISSLSAGSGEQFDQAENAMWFFDTNAEGWTGVYGTPTVVDGWLRPANTAAGQNTGIQSPVVSINGAAYRFIKLRMRRVGTPNWFGLIRWITDADRTWNDAKSTTIAAPQWTDQNIANLDIADLPWNAGSPIRAIRLALTTTQAAGTYIEYDWVAIGRPTPGASVAMVQAEAQARIAADTAEASTREALGVQMRGNYTGSDVAGVTQGLIASEKQARIDGDGVNAQAIQALTARMPAGNGKVASEASVTSLQQAMVSADNALGQRIDTLTATVGNKADSSVVQALTVRVSAAEGKLDSQAQSISQLTSNGRAITGQGKNLIRNGGIELTNADGTTNSFQLGNVWSRNATEGRTGSACLKRGASPTSSSVNCNDAETIWTEPGKTYRYSCWYKVSSDWNGSTGNSKLRLGTQDGSLISGNAYFQQGTTDWTYVEATATINPNGSVTGVRLTVVGDNTAGTLWVDNISLEEVTEQLAQAQATQALTTRVSTAEGKIEAQAQSITSLTANLSDIGGDNLLIDASFEESNSGTTLLPNWQTNSIGSTTIGYSDSALPGSVRAVTISGTQTNNSNYTGIEPATAIRPKAVPGNRYTQSVWASGTVGAKLRFIVQYVNDANGNMGTFQQDFVLTDTLTRYVADSTLCPAGTTRARVIFRVLSASTSGGNISLTLDNAQFQQGSVSTNWAPGVGDAISKANAAATAVTGLTARVTTAEGKIDAQAQDITTLTATVGNIGGDNLFINSSFEDRTSGTVIATGWMGLNSITASYQYNASPLPGSTVAMRVSGTTTAASSYIGAEMATANREAAIPGQVHTLSGYVRGFVGRTLQLYIIYLGANDTQVASNVRNFVVSDTFDRYVYTAPAAPAGTLRVRACFRLNASASGQALWLELDNAQLQLGAVATNWAPSSKENADKVAAAASAISTLTAQVSTIGDKVDAQAAAVTNLTSSIETANGRLDAVIKSGNNAVWDGGFETRNVGTGVGLGRIVASPVRSGARSMSVTANGSIRDVTVATVATTEGRVWYAECWVRNDPDNPLVAGSGDATVGIQGTVRYTTGGVGYPNFKVVSITQLSNEWLRVGGYVVMPANTYELNIRTTFRGGVGSGVAYFDDIFAVDVTDAYNAQQTATAAATAVSSLTTTVTGIGNKVDAQAQQITTLTSTMQGVMTLGESMLINGDFANGVDPWLIAGVSATGNLSTVVWSATAGDGRPGITMTKGDGNNPVVRANNYLWGSTRAGRVLQASVRARGVSGDSNIMVRLRRKNGAGSTASQDLRETFSTTGFETKTFTFNAFSSAIDGWTLEVYCFPNNAVVRVDSVTLVDITDAQAIEGQATAITGLTTRVQNVEGTSSANASAITSLNTRMGSFSSTVWTQMQSDITSNRNTTTALSTRVDGVTASLGNKAEASVVTSLEASVSVIGSGNMLSNSTFASGLDGWGLFYTNDNVGIGNRYTSAWTNDGGVPAGTFALIAQGANNPGLAQVYGQDLPIIPNKDYIFSVYVSGSGWQSMIRLEFVDANGNAAGSGTANAINVPGGGNKLSDYARQFVKVRAPANAAYARPVLLYRVPAGAGAGFLRWVRPMLEEAQPSQTSPGTWNATGVETRASWTTSIRGDGRVGGLRLESTNQMISFDVYADIFRISKPEGGARTEFSDGNWRVYDGNGVLRVAMGVNI